MKKTKIISIIVAMLAVVALGVFMGNYMFKLMEATSTQNNTNNTSVSKTEQSKVEILYGEKKESTPEKIDSSSAIEISNASISATSIQSNTLQSSASLDISQNDKTKPANDTLAFSPNGPRWFAYASTNGLNVRETPNRKGKFLFKVSKGTRGVVKEKKDGWTYIQWDFNKKKGWSIDDYLIQGPANIVDNLVNNKTSENKTTDNEINKEQLTQANIEKELEKSKTIIGIATSAVLTDNVVSYTNGKNLPQKGTISQQNGANIRESPNTKSARLIKLPKGTTVGIKSVKQVDQYQWFEITFSNGSKTGWTREDNLKF